MSSSVERIYIQVKGGRVFATDVEFSWTVKEFMYRLAALVEIDPAEQHLTVRHTPGTRRVVIPGGRLVDYLLPGSVVLITRRRPNDNNNDDNDNGIEDDFSASDSSPLSLLSLSTVESASQTSIYERDSSSVSSRSSSSGLQSLANSYCRLPQIAHVSVQLRKVIFIKKLKLCQILVDFTESGNAELNKHLELQRQMKLDALDELMEYISKNPIFVEVDLYGPIMRMVKANIIRSVSPHVNPDALPYDPAEDVPIPEASWPHLQAVYEFFLTFLDLKHVVASPDAPDLAEASKYINEEFVQQLFVLFDCEDERERDFLTVVLHRIYGKFMSLRNVVKSQTGYIFCQVAYEGVVHHGVAELLNLFSAVVDGFVPPLRDKNKEFLERSILPLHRTKHYPLFEKALTGCVRRFIELDPSLAPMVFHTIVDFFPYNSMHGCIYLDNLAELLGLVEPNDIDESLVKVFALLAKCIGSPHYQLADRSLKLWQVDESLLRFIEQNIKNMLPVLFGALFRSSKEHWHSSVRSEAYSVMRHLMMINRVIFMACAEKHKMGLKEITKRRARATAIGLRSEDASASASWQTSTHSASHSYDSLHDDAPSTPTTNLLKYTATRSRNRSAIVTNAVVKLKPIVRNEMATKVDDTFDKLFGASAIPSVIPVASSLIDEEIVVPRSHKAKKKKKKKHKSRYSSSQSSASASNR